MMDLDKAFLDFLRRHRLFKSDDRILLAVSGGIDSTAMLSLFMNLDVRIGIVHCNFRLRGIDSDEDEMFVRNLAAMHNLPFFVRHFETEAYATENKLSIQVAARDIRYAYFEEVRQKNGYDFIAVAHNSDDAVETFLINLLRGTGIHGLTGIKVKSGKLLRPLLFASREMIVNFARQHSISYRIDKSNLETDYTRNNIRHEIIPRFLSLNPGFRETMLHTIQNLQGVAAVYDKEIQAISREFVVPRENRVHITIDKLTLHPMGMIVLREILHGYRFTAEQIESITHSLEAEPGKLFVSPTHRLAKDRTELIIETLPEEQVREELFYIDTSTGTASEPLHLNYSVFPYTANFEIPSDPGTACLDADRLAFPLVLRHWKHGDYFRPLGMENMKKLSDFFVNAKLSVFEKEKVWIMLSEGKITWIVGQRIDDRFKITPSTRNVFRISLLP